MEEFEEEGAETSTKRALIIGTAPAHITRHFRSASSRGDGACLESSTDIYVLSDCDTNAPGTLFLPHPFLLLSSFLFPVLLYRFPFFRLLPILLPPNPLAL